MPNRKLIGRAAHERYVGGMCGRAAASKENSKHVRTKIPGTKWRMASADTFFFKLITFQYPLFQAYFSSNGIVGCTKYRQLVLQVRYNRWPRARSSWLSSLSSLR